jgi:hypothetical protein
MTGGCIYRKKNWRDEFMKHGVEKDLNAMIYIPSCIKIGLGIQKLIGRNTQTHRGHGDLTSLLLFLSK